MQQQLLHGKIICAGEFDDLNIWDHKLVQHCLKLTILILPEHNASFIKLWQRCGKSFSEGELN